MRTVGGTLIVAGFALIPVSFGCSQGMTIAGLCLTGTSTVANISHSVISKCIVIKRKPKKTKGMFRNANSVDRIFSKIRQFAQRKTIETTGKFNDASLIHQLVSKISQLAKGETQENRFQIIEDILQMFLRKLECLEEYMGDMYIKKGVFEIVEVVHG